MATEQYSIGYEEGFQNGWNAAVDAKPEQPAQQEPVAQYIGEGSEGSLVQLYDDVKKGTNFYTSPPAQRTWVGLTDVEWMNIVNKDQAWFGQRPDEVAHEVAKLVEAKLKEKNT